MGIFKPRWSRNAVLDANGKNGIFGKKCQYALLPKISGENAVQDANLAAEANFVSEVSDPRLLSPTQWRVTPLESARARLAEYRDAYGAQIPEQLLGRTKRAVEADNRQRPNRVWLDAGCLVVGLDSNYLPEAQDADF